MKQLPRAGLVTGLMLLLLGTLVSLPGFITQAQIDVGGSGPGTATDTQWVGNFYNTPDLTGPVVEDSIVYPNGLSENWGAGPPTNAQDVPLNVNPDNFSARFSASVQLQGVYEFLVTADDGVRFYINGQLLVDNFTASGQTTDSVLVNLTGSNTGGTGSYQLTAEYFDAGGDAVIQVTWSASEGTPQPPPTPAPDAFGEVNTVRGLAVRTGPFLGGSLMGVARPENQYPLLARNNQEGIFTWYQIQLDEDTVGWSSGRYLTLTGDPEVLPLVASTQFDVINQTPNFDVLAVTRSVMNLRRYPSERVQRVPEQTQIPWGATVEILARTIQGGQNFWFQVRYRAEDGNDYYGWIYAPYVEILDENRAPIDAIPIY
jgi:hypothetical protein